ncbi:hypothetical protein AKG07_03290 [Microbacterium sp. CGR1]|nr:hypothetical protein AKG07_03290 [Microbacterium sp. CGR1]
MQDADPRALDNAGLIPEGARLEFDPARIFDVGIGADANASLHALVDSGHSLVWHGRQTRLTRKVWGVPCGDTAQGPTARPRHRESHALRRSGA